MEQCIFCKIAAGSIPAEKVYEDDYFVAFLDINPVNKGHTLVMPKIHHETIIEMPEELAGGMAIITERVAKAIFQALNPDGIKLEQNNGEAAGQLVPHVHFHVVPRYRGDHERESRTLKYDSEEETRDYAKRIGDLIPKEM